MKKTTPGGPRLRPLDTPQTVQVRTGAHDTPLQVRLARMPLRVVSVRERWRIDDEWWRVPIHRIYHQVVLEDGRVVTLYRDLVNGRWYLHGRRVASPRGPDAIATGVATRKPRTPIPSSTCRPTPPSSRTPEPTSPERR